MKRRFFSLLALAELSFAAVPGAQPTQAQYDSLAARVAMLEQVLGEWNRRPTVTAPVFDGDVRINGRLCINADCVDGLENQIQIFGDVSTGIYFESNRNRRQHQLAVPHWGEIGLQSDGGFRTNNNARWIRQADGSHAMQTDGVRPWGSVGFDSQSTHSGQQRRPGFEHDNTQDWWIAIDEYTKTISLQSPRPGWKWGLTTSSGLISLDRWYFPPCCSQ